MYCKANYSIRALKTAFENLYITFLNNDSSVDIASISLKSPGNVLYGILEGSVSQNVDLDPGHFFMLWKSYGKRFFHYYLRLMPYNYN